MHHPGGFIGVILIIFIVVVLLARLARSFRRTTRMMKHGGGDPLNISGQQDNSGPLDPANWQDIYPGGSHGGRAGSGDGGGDAGGGHHG
jgi:hypothetical protein